MRYVHVVEFVDISSAQGNKYAGSVKGREFLDNLMSAKFSRRTQLQEVKLHSPFCRNRETSE
jgi:hypothetical protein